MARRMAPRLQGGLDSLIVPCEGIRWLKFLATQHREWNRMVKWRVEAKSNEPTICTGASSFQEIASSDDNSWEVNCYLDRVHCQAGWRPLYKMKLHSWFFPFPSCRGCLV